MNQGGVARKTKNIKCFFLGFWQYVDNSVQGYQGFECHLKNVQERLENAYIMHVVWDHVGYPADLWSGSLASSQDALSSSGPGQVVG